MVTRLNKELCTALDQPAEDLGFLEALPSKAQQQLLEDIEAARAEHKRLIIDSLNEALNHVPRLLRGPLKKIFGV